MKGPRTTRTVDSLIKPKVKPSMFTIFKRHFKLTYKREYSRKVKKDSKAKEGNSKDQVYR